MDKGGQILVARNCHKAVYHAIYLRELSATYIYPHEDPKLGINGGISPGRCGNVSGGKSGDPGGADHFADL